MVEKVLDLVGKRSFKISIIILFFCLVAVFVYFPNYAKLKEIRGETARILLEAEKVEEEIADYEEKGEGIKDNPYLYEKIARDDLGVVRNNEIVIDIE